MIDILIYLAVTILIIGLLSTSLFSVVMLVPGHVILSWFRRFAKIQNIEKGSDADGSLSIIVGMVFWALLIGGGYVAYRLSQYLSA